MYFVSLGSNVVSWCWKNAFVFIVFTLQNREWRMGGNEQHFIPGPKIHCGQSVILEW